MAEIKYRTRCQEVCQDFLRYVKPLVLDYVEHKPKQADKEWDKAENCSLHLDQLLLQSKNKDFGFDFNILQETIIHVLYDTIVRLYVLRATVHYINHFAHFSSQFVYNKNGSTDKLRKFGN